MKNRYLFDATEPKRNVSVFTVRGWLLILIAVFFLVCLTIGTLNTKYSFQDNAIAILAKQDALIARCDTMQSELTEMSVAVEKWGGVK